MGGASTFLVLQQEGVRPSQDLRGTGLTLSVSPRPEDTT